MKYLSLTYDSAVVSLHRERIEPKDFGFVGMLIAALACGFTVYRVIRLCN
jgi:hypothetical protein